MGLGLGMATLLGSAISGAGGLISNLFNKNIADNNIKYQREANNQNIAFQRQENEITRMREDNAVQRRALDLQNAGLSKTLSAGSPASAQPLTAPQTQAVNNQFKYESVLQKMNIANVLQNMAVKQAEIKIAQQKADNETMVAESESAKNYASVDNLGSSTRYNNALAELTEQKTPYEIQQLKKDIDYTTWQINNAMADYRIKGETVKKIIAETSHIVAQTNHLSKQDELLVQQIITETLTQEKLKLDVENTRWDMDWYHGQRIPVGSLGTLGKEASLFTGNIGNLLNGMSFGLYDKLNEVFSKVFKFF